MNETLLKSFTADEVEEALNSIRDLKALGQDGIPSIFVSNAFGVDGG